MNDDAVCKACASGYYEDSYRNYAHGTRCWSHKLTSCGSGRFLLVTGTHSNNQCLTCAAGYYKSGTNAATSCSAYGGSCSQGALITQSSRRQHHHCGSCNGGHYLSGRTCKTCAAGYYKSGTNAATSCVRFDRCLGDPKTDGQTRGHLAHI